MATRQVIVYIAMSVDGFIAKEDGDISWLSIVEAPPEDYGYADFVRSVDTVIMGRKTYDKVLSFCIPFPHSDRKCYVLSREKKGSDEHVEFYNDDPGKLIDALRNKEGGNIFIDGGAEVIFELMKTNLIDKYIISTIPVFLGSGIALFKTGRPEQFLQLTRTCSFPSGLIQAWYEKR